MRARTLLTTLMLLGVLLAGCSEKEPVQSTEPPEGIDTDPGTGIIRGVVVDEAIRPVSGATVSVQVEGKTQATVTAEDGRFVFSDLAPGTYLVKASHPLYDGAQTAVDVVADVLDPASARIQLTRVVSVDAYSQQIKFTGFIQCGYVVLIVSSLCVNDYSTLVVPGGCCPELRELLDDRGYVSEVGQGWETMVFELTWEPSAQGTSPEMFVLVSYTNRTSTDFFGNAGGAAPVLLRLEKGVQHASSQGEPPMVPEQGMDNLYTYAGVEGFPAAVGFSQEFEIIQTNFYQGKPPEEWSFVAGDPLPF